VCRFADRESGALGLNPGSQPPKNKLDGQFADRTTYVTPLWSSMRKATEEAFGIKK